MVNWPPGYKPSCITRKKYELTKEVFDWAKTELAKCDIKWKNCGLAIIDAHTPEKVEYNQAESISGDEKLCDEEDDFLFFIVENPKRFSYLKFSIPADNITLSLRIEIEPYPKTLRLKIFDGNKNITNQYFECEKKENFYWLKKIKNIKSIINLSQKQQRRNNESRPRKTTHFGQNAVRKA